MDSWLKTGRLASGKNVSACSPAEYNENISEKDVSGLSVKILYYLPGVIKVLFINLLFVYYIV